MAKGSLNGVSSVIAAPLLDRQSDVVGVVYAMLAMGIPPLATRWATCRPCCWA